MHIFILMCKKIKIKTKEVLIQENLILPVLIGEILITYFPLISCNVAMLVLMNLTT